MASASVAGQPKRVIRSRRAVKLAMSASVRATSARNSGAGVVVAVGLAGVVDVAPVGARCGGRHHFDAHASSSGTLAQLVGDISAGRIGIGKDHQALQSGCPLPGRQAARAPAE